MKRTLVVIGGGELRDKTTLPIDSKIVSLAGIKNGVRRYALFFPTASHDSKPYFNSFRKTYTSELDCKADVALVCTGEMDIEHIKEKINKADIIYVGGGDTALLMQVWRDKGILPLIREAYENGTVICGLSAGAICWYDKCHSDTEIMQNGTEGDYVILDGFGWLQGICYPHYDTESRRASYDKIHERYQTNVALEGNSAIVYIDEEIVGSVTSGGKAYLNGVEVEEIK